MKGALIHSVRATVFLAGTFAVVPVVAQEQAPAQQPPMGFFIAGTVPGHGNLGGLEGADAICQELAEAAGSGNRIWRAYLSTQAQNGVPAVDARGRIGNGPWHNSRGELIAANIHDLHGDFERDRNNITFYSALTETGDVVSPRDANLRPEGLGNEHDILTGSDSHGRAWAVDEDRTCMNWTSDSPDARGWVGHHDRTGGGNTSWNSVHSTRGGCHADGFIATGGTGRFYCFAAD